MCDFRCRLSGVSLILVYRAPLRSCSSVSIVERQEGRGTFGSNRHALPDAMMLGNRGHQATLIESLFNRASIHSLLAETYDAARCRPPRVPKHCDV